MDMNDPSAVARFRGQPYPPGPRQFDTYHRLVGPRLDAQQMYSVCQDSQQSSYQVCFDPRLSAYSDLLIVIITVRPTWQMAEKLELLIAEVKSDKYHESIRKSWNCSQLLQ